MIYIAPNLEPACMSYVLRNRFVISPRHPNVEEVRPHLLGGDVAAKIG
jgi:hypothetical protein